MLLERFNEPSTYAGIGLVCAGIQHILIGDLNGGLTSVVTGIIAIFKSENK